MVNFFVCILVLLEFYISLVVSRSLEVPNGKCSPTVELRTPPVPPVLPDTASQEEVSVYVVYCNGRCDVSDNFVDSLSDLTRGCTSCNIKRGLHKFKVGSS